MSNLVVTARRAVELKIETITKALPQDERTIQRFKQAALAIASSKGISDCSPESVVKSVYHCARLNLIPDPVLQQVYVVPFRNRGVKEATVIVSYKGLITLARRADPELYVDAGVVYENDDYILSEGMNTEFKLTKRWWQKNKEKGQMVFAYCVSAQPGQRTRLVVVPFQEAERIGKASKSGMRPGTPWHDHFEAMSMKTAVRQSARLWSLSPDKVESRRFVEAVDADEAGSDSMASPGAVIDDTADLMEPHLPDSGERRIGKIGDTNDVPDDGDAGDGDTTADAGGDDPVVDDLPAAAPVAAPPPDPTPTQPAAKRGPTGGKVGSDVRKQLIATLASKLAAAGIEQSDEQMMSYVLCKATGDTAAWTKMPTAPNMTLLLWLTVANKLTTAQIGEYMADA